MSSGMHLREYYESQLEDKKAIRPSGSGNHHDRDDEAEGSFMPSKKFLWAVLIVAGILAGSAYLYLTTRPDPSTAQSANKFQQSLSQLTSVNQSLFSLTPETKPLPTHETNATKPVSMTTRTEDTTSLSATEEKEHKEEKEETKRGATKQEVTGVDANELMKYQQLAFSYYAMILQRDQLIIQLQQEVGKRDEQLIQIKQAPEPALGQQQEDHEESDEDEEEERDRHKEHKRVKSPRHSPRVKVHKSRESDDENEEQEDEVVKKPANVAKVPDSPPGSPEPSDVIPESIQAMIRQTSPPLSVAPMTLQPAVPSIPIESAAPTGFSFNIT